MSCASWIRFWSGFGTILDSQMAPHQRSLRRPRGIKKLLLLSLAFQDVSRKDFGPHWHPLGLVFESFLDTILAWKFSPKCVCLFSFALQFVLLHVLWILLLVSIRDIFFTVLGIANQKVSYCFSHVHFRRAISHNISHVHRYAILRFAHCSMISMSMMGCAWLDVEVLASRHWGICCLWFLPLALLERNV